MKPISILYTIPNFITAGSGAAMLNIIKRLNRSSFQPAVCVSKLGGRLDDEVRSLGIPLIEAPYFFPVKPYSTLFTRINETAKISKPFKFDLWHSFHYSDDYSEPLVAYFSGAEAWVYTKKNMNWGTNAWLLRSLIAKRIVTINSEMKELFFQGPILKKKVKLIHRGLDLDLFTLEQCRDDNKEDLDTNNKRAVSVACVAHLVPVKGHPTLIEAVSKLENVHLFLAGSPLDQVYTKQLKEQVVNLGLEQCVHFLGNINDVSGFISQMDIVVLPSRSEAFGVALIEAMACGKACIASDISGPRDIIQDGVSGFLVSPENPDELAKVIRILQDDPGLRKKIGQSARKRVVDHFSIEREVQAHEQLYLDLITGKGGRF